MKNYKYVLYRFTLHATGFKWFKLVAAKLFINLNDTAGTIIKTDHQQCIPWNFGVKLRHFIFFQSLLCLSKRKLSGISDPQDHISLPGLFFTG